MLQSLWANRYTRWGGILVLLILANIVSYIYNNWGLITVKVTDKPLGKVISSIEWQGWVKIYTNLPLDSKVTMYVDHVPLAEAMESLAANVSGPANGASGDRPRDGGGSAAPGGGGNPPGGGPAAVVPEAVGVAAGVVSAAHNGISLFLSARHLRK